MAAATNNIRRAEHREVAGLCCRACGFFVDGEFGKLDTHGTEFGTLFGGLVVVGQQWNCVIARNGGEPRDGCRYVIFSRKNTSDERIEFAFAETRALHHTHPLFRIAHGCSRHVHVVVEGEKIDAAADQPFRNRGFGFEIVSFLPQVKPRVGGELGPHRLDRIEKTMCVLRSAQAGLP